MLNLPHETVQDAIASLRKTYFPRFHGTGSTSSSARRSPSMQAARTTPASVRPCCIRFDPGCVWLAKAVAYLFPSWQ